MTKAEQKINSIKRYIMWHFLSKKLDLIHVVEYPKSGGTWMTQLISDYLGMYYPRNVIPKFQKGVIHGHYKYDKSFNKTIFVVRDGRDIVVSYYHHLLIGNDKTPKYITDYYKKKVNFTEYENVKKNLPEFIKFLNEDYTKRFNRYRWNEFVDTYRDKEDVLFVKYEDMLLDTQEELIKALNFIGVDEINIEKVKNTVEKFSFKKQTNRLQGTENKSSFLRKGISGDWKNYFTKQSSEVFDSYSGNCLKGLGYEGNDDWINITK